MAARGGLWLGGYLGPTTYLGPPVPLAVASDTSSATPMRRTKRRRIGTHSPGYGLGGYGTTPYGSPSVGVSTAETARPVTRRKLRRLDETAEVSASEQVKPVKHKHVGMAKERQRARPLRSRGVLGRAVEQGAARPVLPVKRRLIGQAVELAAATTIAHSKRRRVGVAKERQRARPIT